MRRFCLSADRFGRLGLVAHVQQEQVIGRGPHLSGRAETIKTCASRVPADRRNRRGNGPVFLKQAMFWGRTQSS